jgi:peptidoglycan/LPS O-acetylase OafA/YrhL
MRIATLDSLRGIFALMVVLLHFPADWTFLNHPLVRNDGISVDFFFVLSGFVVSFAYAESIRSRTDFGRFLIKRIGRIWPLHAVILILFLGLSILRSFAAQGGESPGNAFFDDHSFWPVFAQDLFFLNAFRTVPSFQLNFPAWSIGAEFWTYVVFGALVLAIRYVALVSSLCMALCLLVLMGFVDPGFGQAFGFALFRSIFFFLVGYFTWRVWQMLPKNDLNHASLIEAAMVVIVVAAIMYQRQLPVAPVTFAFIFAATILVFSFQSGMISRLLLARPMQAIGQRSYSIYLLHILVMAVVGTVLRMAERKFGLDFYISGQVAGEPIDLLFVWNRFGTDLAVLAMLALIIWLSGLTYRWIEQPGQNLAKRIADHFAPAKARPS